MGVGIASPTGDQHGLASARRGRPIAGLAANEGAVDVTRPSASCEFGTVARGATAGHVGVVPANGAPAGATPQQGASAVVA